MAYVNGKEVLFSANFTTSNLAPYAREIIDGTVETLPQSVFSGVTRIRNCAFRGCESLKSAFIPEWVTIIGSEVFYGCTALENVALSEGLERIYHSAFMYCYKLTSIDIPASVVSIASQAFMYCTVLATVRMRGAIPPTQETNVFASCRALTSIIVPKGSADAYKAATNWSNYAEIITEASE